MGVLLKLLQNVSFSNFLKQFCRKTFFSFVLSFTLNWLKLAAFFSVILAQKWNWLLFLAVQSWSRKNETEGRGEAACRQFHFFPDQLWRFHNFSPLKIMKPQPVSFLSQNNKKQTASFIKFHVKLGTHTKKRRFLAKTYESTCDFFCKRHYKSQILN